MSGSPHRPCISCGQSAGSTVSLWLCENCVGENAPTVSELFSGDGPEEDARFKLLSYIGFDVAERTNPDFVTTDSDGYQGFSDAGWEWIREGPDAWGTKDPVELVALTGYVEMEAERQTMLDMYTGFGFSDELAAWMAERTDELDDRDNFAVLYDEMPDHLKKELVGHRAALKAAGLEMPADAPILALDSGMRLVAAYKISLN